MSDSIKAFNTTTTDGLAVTATQSGDKRYLDVNVLGLGAYTPVNMETRNASTIISALKCVYSVSASSVAIGESDSDFDHASIFGIAVTAAQANESIQIQTYGVLRDSSFVWPANTQLFVDATGSLTSTAPVTGFRTLVANAQGPGQIFINIQEPITL